MSAEQDSGRPWHGGPRPRALTVAFFLLLSLIATIGIGGIETVGGQGGGYAIRYRGTLTLGGAPASGQEILVVVAHTPTDTTLCARTTSGEGGAYTIDIPRDPRCVRRTRADPLPTWLFLVNGEQVGRDNRGIQLEPASTAATDGPEQNRTLAGKTIPGLTAAVVDTGGVASGSGPALIVVRYFGVLTYGDDARPAPRGTRVAVVGDGVTDCGEGRVLDDQGHYSVDIPPRPACVAARARERPVQWEFRVGGETAGRSSRGLSLDEPDLFAQAEEFPLHTRAMPQPPLTGGIAIADCTVDEGTATPDDRCPDVPARVLVDGDGEFTARVTDCFRRYRRTPAGTAVMGVLLALHRSPDPDLPTTRATIQQSVDDITLPYRDALGITIPESDELASRGVPMNAVIHVLSQAFVSLPGFPDAPDQVEWCALLAHELTHAADHLAGTLDNTPCSVGEGGTILARELKAQAVANSFLLAEGRDPFAVYEGVSLPHEALYPTPESWARYQRNAICSAIAPMDMDNEAAPSSDSLSR